MEHENLNNPQAANSDLGAVISWRSCLNDSPEIGQEVEILHDKGDGTEEVIKHKWTGWENIQWVMYCCKGWRACL